MVNRLMKTRLRRHGPIAAKTPLALPGQKIGLLGGSFNPPHAAHRMISLIALRRLGLDRVWWVVTPGNPLKSHGELATLEARLAAIRRLVGNDPRIVATAFESALGHGFTAGTLAFLSHRHRSVRFVWLMGADNLATFHRWHHWQVIAATMPIAVVDRPKWRLKALASPAAQALSRYRISESADRTLASRKPPAWAFLTGPLSPLSSTALRAAGRRER